MCDAGSRVLELFMAFLPFTSSVPRSVYVLGDPGLEHIFSSSPPYLGFALSLLFCRSRLAFCLGLPKRDRHLWMTMLPPAIAVVGSVLSEAPG